jgi:hypothetical protein
VIFWEGGKHLRCYPIIHFFLFVNYLLDKCTKWISFPRERQANQGRGHFQLIDNGNFLQEKEENRKKPKPEEQES